MQININIEKKHFYILLAVLVVVGLIGYAIGDGWTPAQPFHDPLYTNEITSATDGSPDTQPVVISDDLEITGTVNSYYIFGLIASEACRAMNPTSGYVRANFLGDGSSFQSSGDLTGSDVCELGSLHTGSTCDGMILVEWVPASGSDAFSLREQGDCGTSYDISQWAGPAWDSTIPPHIMRFACCNG